MCVCVWVVGWVCMYERDRDWDVSVGPCIYSFFFYFLIFIYLAASGFNCSMQTVRCSMWDLVPWPGIEPRPPALGTWSLSHCTTREVPGPCVYLFLLNCIFPNLCYWDLDFYLFIFWPRNFPLLSDSCLFLTFSLKLPVCTVCSARARSLCVVQALCCVGLFATPWTAACQASLSFTISQSLPKFMSIE